VTVILAPYYAANIDKEKYVVKGYGIAFHCQLLMQESACYCLQQFGNVS